MKLFRTSIALVCFALLRVPAHAQTYPSKPLTIVVTLAAGGAADVIARAVAQRLTEEWRQPVLVENRGGANNQVGTAAVAKAAADGYTLLLTPEHTFTVNPFLYRKLPYDPVKDSRRSRTRLHQSIAGGASVACGQDRRRPDRLGEIQTRPVELRQPRRRLGSASDQEMLQSMTGAKLTPVYYKGAAPALTDVVAGHIPMMFVSTGLVVQPAQVGQLRLLGVGSKNRLAKLPDLSTVGETLAGFTAVVWFGLFAPNGTPREIIATINAAVQRILADPDFHERILVPNFYEPISGSPDQFAAHIRSNSERWRKVIHAAKLAIEE